MICRAGLMDGKVILANLASGDFTQQTVLLVQLSHSKEIYSAGGKRRRGSLGRQEKSYRAHGVGMG